MIQDTIRNMTFHHEPSTTVSGDNAVTIYNKDKFKVTIIIDNVVQYFFNCYKVTVDKREDGELVTIYDSVTRISSNILLPGHVEMLMIINDSFW